MSEGGSSSSLRIVSPTMASQFRTPQGKESVAVENGQVALALELVLPSLKCSDPGVNVEEAMSSVNDTSEIKMACFTQGLRGIAEDSPPSVAQYLPSPHILSRLQKDQEEQQPSSDEGSRLHYRRPLEATGLFLRANHAGSLILSSTPEVFMIAQHVQEDASSDKAVAVTLRTCYSGIVRAASDKRRLACRSTKAPATSEPEASEVFILEHVPWSVGGFGCLTLTSQPYGTRMSVKLGTSSGSTGVGWSPDEVTLEQAPTSSLVHPLEAVFSQNNIRAAFFRPMFRDPILPCLMLGQPIEACAFPLPTAVFSHALGIPTVDLAYPHTLGTSFAGQRGRVIPTHMRAPFLETTLNTVVKVQPWDSRVPNELRALQTVCSFAAHAELVSGEKSRLPMALPIAVLRDYSNVYQVYPHKGVSLASYLEKRVTEGGGSSSQPFPSALPLASTLCTLSAAVILHGLGLLHGDIHAGNVLVDTSGPEINCCLCDFGSTLPLTRVLQADGGYKAFYKGPPRGGRWDSMPKEQFGSGKWGVDGSVTLGPSSDVFSIGSMLAALLLGRPPFSPPGGQSKLRLDDCLNHKLREAGQLEKAIAFATQSSRASTFPGFFSGWVGAVTHPNPEMRYPTASKALRALVDLALSNEALRKGI